MTYNKINELYRLPKDKLKALLAQLKNDIETLEYIIRCKENPIIPYNESKEIEDLDFEVEISDLESIDINNG